MAKGDAACLLCSVHTTQSPNTPIQHLRETDKEDRQGTFSEMSETEKFLKLGMPITSACRRLKQEDCELEINLHCTTTLQANLSH